MYGRHRWLLLVGLTISHAINLSRLAALRKNVQFDARVKHYCARLRLLKFSPLFDAVSSSLKERKAMTRLSQAQNSCALEALHGPAKVAMPAVRRKLATNLGPGRQTRGTASTGDYPALLLPHSNRILSAANLFGSRQGSKDNKSLLRRNIPHGLRAC